MTKACRGGGGPEAWPPAAPSAPSVGAAALPAHPWFPISVAESCDHPAPRSPPSCVWAEACRVGVTQVPSCCPPAGSVTSGRGTAAAGTRVLPPEPWGQGSRRELQAGDTPSWGPRSPLRPLLADSVLAPSLPSPSQMPAGSCLLSHGLESGWGPGSRSTRAACACCDQPAAWSPSTPASHGSQGVQRPPGLSPYPPAVHALSLSHHACPASLRAPRLLVPGPHFCTRGRPSAGSRDTPPSRGGCNGSSLSVSSQFEARGLCLEGPACGMGSPALWLPPWPHGRSTGAPAPPGGPHPCGSARGSQLSRGSRKPRTEGGALWARGPRPRRAGGSAVGGGAELLPGALPWLKNGSVLGRWSRGVNLLRIFFTHSCARTAGSLGPRGAVSQESVPGFRLRTCPSLCSGSS